MPATFRLVRKKVLNYADNEAGREPLHQFVKLDASLAKHAYSAADKTCIAKTLEQLRPYIDDITTGDEWEHVLSVPFTLSSPTHRFEA